MRVYRMCFWGGLLLIMLRCGGGGDSVITPPGPAPMPDPTWSLSACSTVTGTDAVSLSLDGGASLFGNPQTGFPTSSAFAFGLVATDRRDTLVAAVNNSVLISEDAGCNWRELAVIPTNNIVRLTAGAEGDVFAYINEESVVYRIGTDGDLEVVTVPVAGGTLAAFPSHAGVLRLAAHHSGQLFHSGDNGRSWSPIGTSPVEEGGRAYFAAFAFNDPDHLVLGTTRLLQGSNGAGVWTSFDGGSNWTQGEGFDGRVNGFTGAISAVEPNTVWVLALNVDNSQLPRAIYRSSDGGHTFVKALQADGQVVLTNGTALFTGPEPDKVFFAVTDPTQVVERMTHLYCFDNHTGLLSTRDFAWREVGEIWAMAFNPDHPQNLFFTKTFQLIQ